LSFGLVGKREKAALRKVPPFGLSSPWDKMELLTKCPQIARNMV